MACALAGQAAWASGETDAALQAYRDGNYPAAIKIWRKLAANDNPDAQYALGVAYLKGHGVEWNLTEAIAWFEQAAQAGHVLHRPQERQSHRVQGKHARASRAMAGHHR